MKQFLVFCIWVPAATKGPLENVDSNLCFDPNLLQVSIQFKVIESGHVILFMQGTGFFPPN